jgi:3-hydroxyisobutyrate dehydrogenase/glyoxylate/succinic semialdehyde reductase
MILPEGNPVAILGLGIIGSRASSRLSEVGWKVTSWNRTPKGLPGEVATAGAAVKVASIISLYLKDVESVRSVVTGIADALTPGKIVLNHATLDLETTLWLEQFCAARACRFLDAPFTGSKVAASNGQLLYYIGGDEDLARELEFYLSASGKGSHHCGAVGSATVVKLATNLVSACTVQALAESLAIASRFGVSADCLIQAVALNASSSTLSGMKLPTMAEGDFETHFSLSNMSKDSRYMLDLAKSAKLDTPAIMAVSKRMEELTAAGLGDLDYSAVAKPYQIQS